MKPEDGLRQLAGRLQAGAACTERLLVYLALLRKWNARVNLTSSLEWDAVGPLFHEGLWAGRFCGAAGARHLDIGSGAGFPAIPMAALRPDLRFELVESRTRRAVFLEVAARELGLGHVRVVDRRLDEYMDGTKGNWDVVSWKGVRLRREEVGALLERAPRASLWLFHAGTLPVADARQWLATVQLDRREAFPGRPGWFLSMFHVKRP